MNKKVICLHFLSVTLIILTVVPLLLASYYAVPAADDFSNANAVLSKSDSILKSAVLLTTEEYFSWQGTFSATFLLYACSPLLRGGMGGIRIGCALIVLLYLLSVYFFIFSIVKYVFKEEKLYVINFIYGISIWFLTIGKVVGEAFYWFCGGMVHTLPFAFCILGIGFTVRMMMIPNRKINTILAVLCMLIAAGGSLQVAAVCNVVVLGILLFEWFNKKIRNNVSIIFLSTFLTALLNAGAPGNFARHDAIDEQYHVLRAIWWAIKSIVGNVNFFLTKTPIAIFLLALIMLGYKYGKNVYLSFQRFLLIVIYTLVGTVITDFPVTFGYSTIKLSDRCRFIENGVVIFALMWLSILLGIVLAKCNCGEVLKYNKYKWSLMLVGLIIAYILGWTSELTARDYTPSNIWINYRNYNLREFKEGYEEIFAQLENGKDKDVEIEVIPPDQHIFHSIGIKEDPTHWVNGTVARFYGCKSVTLSPKE